MKIKLIIATSILAFTATAQAAPKKPEACPGVAAITAEGIQRSAIFKDDNNEWAGAIKASKFDTTDKWSFILMGIKAKDADDAYNKAASELDGMTLNSGPMEAPYPMSGWMCVYQTPNQAYSIAVTPAMLDDGQLRQAAHRFK